VGSRAGWIARRVMELCIVVTVACLIIGATTAKPIWFLGGVGYGAVARTWPFHAQTPLVSADAHSVGRAWPTPSRCARSAR